MSDTAENDEKISTVVPTDTTYRQSEEIGKLAGALAQAQSEITSAIKGNENPYFRSRYADLATVWEACRPALSKNGLAVMQPTKTIYGASGAVRVTVTTILAHASGEWISSDLTMQSKDGNPQSVGSCITYARRYALGAMVGVASEDDDGEAAEGRSRGNGASQKATQATHVRTRDESPNEFMPATSAPAPKREAPKRESARKEAPKAETPSVQVETVQESQDAPKELPVTEPKREDAPMSSAHEAQAQLEGFLAAKPEPASAEVEESPNGEQGRSRELTTRVTVQGRQHLTAGITGATMIRLFQAKKELERANGNMALHFVDLIKAAALEQPDIFHLTDDEGKVLLQKIARWILDAKGSEATA